MRVVRSAPITAPWPIRLPTGPTLKDQEDALASGPLPDRVARPWSSWLEGLQVPEPVTASFQRIRAGAAVVVTGQQPMVLGGPLLVLLKAARAVTLARHLEKVWRRPVAPIFWVAGDDHDLGEMLGTAVLDGQGTLRRHRLTVADTRTAANALRVPAQAHQVLQAVVEQTGLPDPERFAPRPEDTLSTWFARSLLVFFADSGLVPLDSSCLDEAGLPLFRKVLERGDAWVDAAQDGAMQLERAGVRPPLSVDADPPLFVIQEGARRRLRRKPSGALLLEDRTVTAEELLDGHREGRWRLSANVSLRVLLQNRALPVAAYVGGPAERLYQAQLGPLHEAFSVRPSPVVPRPSATVVSRSVRRHLRRLGLSAEQWFEEPAPEAGTADWIQRGRALQEQTRDWLGEADPTMEQAVARQSARVDQGLEQLLARAEQVATEGAARLAARRAGVDQALCPGGQPQERTVSPLTFLAECGDSLQTALLDLPAEQEGHWLMIPEDTHHG